MNGVQPIWLELLIGFVLVAASLKVRVAVSLSLGALFHRNKLR